MFVVEKLERTNLELYADNFFFITKGDCDTHREEKRQHPKLK